MPLVMGTCNYMYNIDSLLFLRDANYMFENMGISVENALYKRSNTTISLEIIRDHKPLEAHVMFDHIVMSIRVYEIRNHMTEG